MRPNRLSLSRSGIVRSAQRVLVVLGLLACGDVPTAPKITDPVVVPPSATSLTRVACIADVVAKSVSCQRADESAAVALKSIIALPDGPNADLIVGGQNQFITLTSSNVTWSADVFSFNTTVKNLIPQKLGTTDGVTLDPTGVRVFFENPPVTTSGTGTVDYTNPVGGGSFVDGFATFTQANQAYYQYNEIIAPNATSAQRLWRLHVPASVTTFQFFVYVSAPVQYPTGWIDITPPSATIKAGATQQLTGTVKDVVGRTQSETITWSSNATGVATVDPNTGLVTGVADGTATITATSVQTATRVGTATIVVSTAAGATTTISAAPPSVTVSSPSTITVQAKNAAGQNMTVGGDAVVLNTTLGTIGAITDNNNGTYTATISSNTTGTASITGTINTQTIGTPGSVTFTAGTVNGLAINAGDAQTANSGAAVATAPSVKATDSFGNGVPGVTVTFSVTGGGGTIGTASTTTNSSGVATLPSNWTLGSGGAGCAAATITNCSRNALHAVATGGPNPAVDFKAYIPPVAPTATYQAVGNATLTINSGIGLLNGAFSINGNGANGTGATLAVTTTSATGSNSGAATISGDGSFSYLSAPSYVSAGAATENFTYAVTDGIAATNGTGTLAVNVPTHVWFVQPGYAGTSTGSDVQPYKNFTGTAGAGVESVALAGETILVQNGPGFASGGTLKNTQTVYGRSASAPFTFTTGSAATYRNGATAITLLATGSTSPIGALTLGTGNTLRGITLGGQGTTALVGNSFGTLTVSETDINAGLAQALNLAIGTVAGGGFTAVSSSGGTNNVNINSVGTTGTFALGSGTLTAATSDAFVFANNTGTWTYGGTINNTATFAVNITNFAGTSATLSGNINSLASPAKGISLAGNSAGTISFTGSEIGISSAASAGVSVVSGTGSTTVFAPGNAMQIATSTGTAFTATNAGTVSVTGSSNVISSSGGQAVLIGGPTTIPAAGITFNSTTSAGGTNNVAITGTITGAGSINLGSGALSAATGTSFVATSTTAVPLSYGGTISRTGGGQLVTISNRSGGAATLSGNLSCTASCGVGTGANSTIVVSNNTGGTITLSGTSKVISQASTFDGVSVTNNTGATVAFTGGGLAVTTGGGAAFTATGGGSVEVGSPGTELEFAL